MSLCKRLICLGGFLLSMSGLAGVVTDAEHKTPESFIYTVGSTVTTSPYIGIRSAYDAQDLIVNLPTMNEDLRLLKQRQSLKQRLGDLNLPYANRPLLEISGDVIGQIGYHESFASRSMHDIDLTGARLDFLAEVGPWAFGYVSLDYDNSFLDSALKGSGQRIANSNVYLKRGFLTVGDLDVSPVYFSLGQMFVPFGRYSTALVTAPLTGAIGRTNARAALLGVSYEAFYGSVYAFNGESDVASTGINQWGVNAGFEYQEDCLSFEGGAGLIGNIADAPKFQNTGRYSGFMGFGAAYEYEQLQHRVPAYDLHGKVKYDCAALTVEYIDSTRSFDEADLTYNGQGARPRALHIEGSYAFPLMSKGVLLAAAYSRSWESLALNLPKHSFIVALNSALFKNSIASLEYRHDCNYSSGDTASGAGMAEVASPGGSRNSVVFQMGIYY